MSENLYSSNEPVPSAGAYVGYNVLLQVAGEDIAVGQRMSFTINNNVRQYYVVSSRTPLNIETDFLIRGNIRHMYINTALLRLAMGRDQANVDPHGTHMDGSTFSDILGTETTTPSFVSPDDFNRLPEITVACVLKREDTAGSETQKVTLNGVKIDTWDFNVDSNDVIIENINFFAENIKVSSPVAV